MSLAVIPDQIRCAHRTKVGTIAYAIPAAWKSIDELRIAQGWLSALPESDAVPLWRAMFGTLGEVP